MNFMLKFAKIILAVGGILLLVGLPSSDPDITSLGGDLSSSLPGRAAIQVVAPNVPEGERRDKQLLGFGTFHRIVSAAEGLGPRFNNDACGGCHVENGKGHVKISRSILTRSSMVVKVALPGKNSDGTPKDVPGVGGQIQDHSTSGDSDFPIWLTWQSVTGKFPDGTPYKLRKPNLRFRVPGYNQTRLRHTLLMVPPVIGPGLLEAVPDASIQALEDPKDSNKDGISGRINWVTNRKSGQAAIGRFGFKAGHPTLEQFSSAALFNDMGISNRIFADSEGNLEISDADMELLVVYQALAGVPFARNQEDSTVQRGKRIFQDIGCNSCHVMTLQTGDVGDERTNQTIHPFTDLLLHDMGPDLASTRGDGQASGREWRTTPLWGLGFAKTLSNVAIRYLHDGRARSIQEAIIWHGGESKKSKEKFLKLKKSDRSALIKFLESL